MKPPPTVFGPRMPLTSHHKGTMPNAEPHATPLLKVGTTYLPNFQSDEVPVYGNYLASTDQDLFDQMAASISGLGSESVVVDVWVPRGITYISG